MAKKNVPLDRLSPITATKKKLNWPKVWIFFWLALISYGMIFYTLFWQFFVLQSMIYVMIFFICFHFLYLELRKLPIKYILYTMLAVTILEGIFIWYSSILLLFSMLVINIGVVYLARFLQGASHDKIRFSSRWYFNAGGYIFTVFITVGYSLFILGYYEKFPFTCQDLSDASSRVVSFFTNPVEKGMEKIKTDTTNIFNTKVKDVAIIWENLSLETKWSGYLTFIQKFNTYKANFVDQALKDNSTVNMGICDYVLGQMNKIYNNPAFKASVILLMFLILYGFIRIVFWVMTGIGFIIFKILFRFNAYHIKVVLKEVEDIE